jgi:DNA-binding transcriptional MerR regulator
MTFGELRAEYERERIGPLILAGVDEIVRRVARRYPPALYAEVAHEWDEDTFEALVQEFVTDTLLGAGQLDYTMSVAIELADFERLTGRQLRRHLREHRRRTVVDNLMDRVRDIVTTAPYSQQRGWFALEPRGADAWPPSAAELKAAERAAALVPREVSDSHDRAPRVYAPRDLERLVATIARSLPGGFALEDVRKILARLLTELAPRQLLSLSDDDSDDNEPAGPGMLQVTSREVERTEGGAMMAVPEIAPEAAALVRDAVERLVDSLAGEERTILRAKLAGVADAELARLVGVSRPTLANRKQVILGRLEAELDGLDESVQRRVLQELQLELAEEHGDG